ncbi:MAG: thymidylate synthase [Candidatus Thiodiazotropha lotti]
MLQELLDNGSERTDRTGVGTNALFGRTLRFNLQEGFPVLTTKRIFWKTAFKEILWMLGCKDTNPSMTVEGAAVSTTRLRVLLEQNVHIWSEWPHAKYVKETGDNISLKDFEDRVLNDDAFDSSWGSLGPVYGKQWRAWSTEDGRSIDQVSEVISMLKNDPYGRRILWDGWNVADIYAGKMALPPCHKQYQFFVNPETNTLSGACVQRSADAFLGLGFNLANLALVTSLLAEQTGYVPGEIVWFGLDTHLYLNHVEQAREQLARTPREFPKLIIKSKPDSLFGYSIDDLDLEGYDPYPAIKAQVAV